MEQIKLPIKTKIAAWWLIITSIIFIFIFILVLMWFAQFSAQERAEGMVWLLWFFLAFGYIRDLIFWLSPHPLTVMVIFPFFLPILCIFFGISLLTKKRWTRKKEGHSLIINILSLYFLTIPISILISTIKGSLYVDIFFSSVHVFFITLPPLILLRLSRKNKWWGVVD